MKQREMEEIYALGWRRIAQQAFETRSEKTQMGTRWVGVFVSFFQRN